MGERVAARLCDPQAQMRVGVMGGGGEFAHAPKPSFDGNPGLMAHRIRQGIVEQSHRAHVGHIGSALSVADTIAALYCGGMNIADPAHPDRDRFVLSKGHACLALYCALNLKGWLSDDQLNGYCGDGSLLGVHPERDLFGVDFTTGSLGHGLALGCGAALAARLQGSARRVFVLLSDAECNEGSVWESAMFAGHRQLGNLVALVDLNGQQALGYTKDVVDLSSMGGLWRGFGWQVHDVDGHDCPGMVATLSSLKGSRPHVLIARTTFGKGVSFMQGQIRWHYLPMSQEQYLAAMDELGSAP
ncbi:MAG: transketolase [Actinomycetota bacterium]